MRAQNRDPWREGQTNEMMSTTASALQMEKHFEPQCRKGDSKSHRKKKKALHLSAWGSLSFAEYEHMNNPWEMKLHECGKGQRAHCGIQAQDSYTFLLAEYWVPADYSGRAATPKGDPPRRTTTHKRENHSKTMYNKTQESPRYREYLTTGQNKKTW